jgi:hypothetical protein
LAAQGPSIMKTSQRKQWTPSMRVLARRAKAAARASN